MKPLLLFKKYAYHDFLRQFALSLFYAFGALMIYQKTGSIVWTLGFNIVAITTGLLFRSVGMVLLWKTLRRFGINSFISIGLLLLALSFLGLFYFNTSVWYLALGFIFSAIVHDIGGSLYWVPANAVLFETIGSLNLPGKYSSIIHLTHIAGSVLSGIIGFIFHSQEVFSWLFILSSALLLLSLIPLRGIDMPVGDHVSLRSCLKSISWKAFLGNLDFEAYLKVVILPLIIFLNFDSLSKSVWIIALSHIGSSLVAYLTGKLKDHNNKSLNILALVLKASIWVAYGFASDASEFILLAVADGIVGTVISVGREARLSREVANSGKAIPSTIAIETARQIGPLMVLLFFLVIYRMTHTLPQIFLVLGALFVLPKAIYAIGNIDGFIHNKISPHKISRYR